jgi:ParB family transcriptional regulator, chromosome partitioning protein
MPVEKVHNFATQIIALSPSKLKPNRISLSIYGDPAAEVDDLLPSIRENGILVPLVVVRGREHEGWEVISGHRRLACAVALGMTEVPCEVRHVHDGITQLQTILEYNRQRRKTFSQLMREADALEEVWRPAALARRMHNLLPSPIRTDDPLQHTDCRNSDNRTTRCEREGMTDNKTSDRKGVRGRTDVAIARRLAMGGKDIYRQARIIWQLARKGDVRAQSSVDQLDAGTKTIHAAYKDMRRRNRYSTDFRPTPYDVWSFRHDRAFGIPHPGSIPSAIVAHALYYFSPPGGLVVDPMAGGGTTLDVCSSMGRRCLAYDLQPARADIQAHDIRDGFPTEGAGCDLIFCDPPYHTMLARQYVPDGIASMPLADWVFFLQNLAEQAFKILRPGGYLTLLLAAQTEKDLPRGFGYLDHAFLGFTAGLRAGFLPARRISCPLEGTYLPQHVRQARCDGRLLGQVRDLLVLRKPVQPTEPNFTIPFLQDSSNSNPFYETHLKR